jgi:ligand-binding SRPBCC domain-containing protein
MSKFNQLKFTQKIPISIEQAWDFFSSPANLAKITPKHMGFDITSDFKENQKMYEGQIITYKVSPILGIKLDWMTEITHITDNEYFVDEQRFGPYAMWHHQHHFKAINGGIEMTDLVNYVLPLGFLGNIANQLFVKAQLKEIFEYRFIAVEQLFGKFRS